MKRDMDLVRKILFAVEKEPWTGSFFEVEIEGHSAEQIAYHILLLSEADLLEIADCSTFGNPNYLPIRLTWSGHEFLDAARNDNVWNQVKEVTAKAGGLAFEVLKPLLIQMVTAMARQYLPLPPQP